MEKLESPDYQMDISENCTTENNSNLVSPSLSSLQADTNDFFIEEKNNEKFSKSNHNLSSEKEDRESFVNQNTYRLSVNSRQKSSSAAQKLTPTKNHPLEISISGNEEEEEDDDDELCGNSNVRNFPDVVLMTHQHQQQQQFSDTQQKPTPLRLNQPTATNKINMNSVNNNDGMNRVTKYREPSPVS
jgi:hypothetical protein